MNAWDCAALALLALGLYAMQEPPLEPRGDVLIEGPSLVGVHHFNPHSGEEVSPEEYEEE